MNTLTADGFVALWTVVHALRWVLVLLLVAFLCATTVAQSRRADEAEDNAADWQEHAEQWQKYAEDLEEELDEEIRSRTPIVALPARKDTETTADSDCTCGAIEVSFADHVPPCPLAVTTTPGLEEASHG